MISGHIFMSISTSSRIDISDEFSFEHMLEFSKLAVSFAVELVNSTSENLSEMFIYWIPILGCHLLHEEWYMLLKRCGRPFDVINCRALSICF